MIDLSLIHGDISAILLSQEWSAINMVFSSQLQLMILDRENTAKYFTADFEKTLIFHKKMFAGSTQKTSQHFLVAILLELPIPVVEGADLQFL